MPTSDADAGDISEREPLLAKAKSSAASYVEVGASVANAAVPSGADGFADSNGIVKVSPQAEDDGDANGADAEQQRPDDEDGARAAQFMGMPEVRKKMKYILPALSIGVCISFFTSKRGRIVWKEHRLIVILRNNFGRFFSRPQIRLSSSQARAGWGVICIL